MVVYFFAAPGGLMDLFLGFEKIDFCRSWIYLEDGLLVTFGDYRITPHLCQPFLGVNCCEGLPRCPDS